MYIINITKDNCLSLLLSTLYKHSILLEESLYARKLVLVFFLEKIRKLVEGNFTYAVI